MVQVAGYYGGIDEEGRLIEVGLAKWPSLMHLAWQGQWQHYLHNLKANLSKPALTVPIFVNQVTSSLCLDLGQEGVDEGGRRVRGTRARAGTW